MNERTPAEKAKVRERRNRMLDTAAAAELSLTEGVREIHAIAGMTQDEFAKHRGVSARVIKAIELEQGNPTVATLNRIGQFFGREMAFVPVRSKKQVDVQTAVDKAPSIFDMSSLEAQKAISEAEDNFRRNMEESMGKWADAFIEQVAQRLKTETHLPSNAETKELRQSGKKKKPRPST